MNETTTTERAGQLARFREAFPEATVEVEATGGGCEHLAFRWEGEGSYYAATDGEANLPETHDGQPLAEGGWGVVLRYDDEMDPVVVGGGWDDGIPASLSDDDVIAAVERDRLAEGREEEAPQPGEKAAEWARRTDPPRTFLLHLNLAIPHDAPTDHDALQAQLLREVAGALEVGTDDDATPLLSRCEVAVVDGEEI